MAKLDITGQAQFDVEPDTATIAILVEGRDYDYEACSAAINRCTQAARRVLEDGHRQRCRIRADRRLIRQFL